MVRLFGVVVAAGSGTRLGSTLPKALVELGERPLVWHAVDALVRAGCEQVVVTAPTECPQLVMQALADQPQARVVVGGERRQDSVRIGIANLDGGEDDVVLVHDAARPLTPVSAVQRVVDAVLGGAPAVIPVVPVIDTIREVAEQVSRVVDRSALRAVQTPQGFRLGLLRRAHEAAATVDVTDDAAAAELLGATVSLVAGDRLAMKVTEPIDLALVRELVKGS